MTHTSHIKHTRGLVPSWSVLLVAFLAVYWTSFRWFERNLCLFSAFWTSDLVHLAWTAVVVTASLSITHIFHSYFVIIQWIFRQDTRRMQWHPQCLLLNHSIFYGKINKKSPFTTHKKSETVKRNQWLNPYFSMTKCLLFNKHIFLKEEIKCHFVWERVWTWIEDFILTF